MPEPRLAKYKTWPKDRLYKAAIDKCLNHGWTQTAAAKEFGLSRQHLSGRMKGEREKRNGQRETHRGAAARPHVRAARRGPDGRWHDVKQ